MEKQTMGSFMAALRRAKGMTQQEVADRLNVSNKAVSRWERDECAPDIGLIPAIAELFGVSCDELLAGRPLGRREETARPRVEKQRRAMLRRALSRFRTMEAVSIGLAAAGWLCALGLSYGLYLPVVGFFVMLLFQVAAVVVAVSAGGQAKAAWEDNELLEQGEPSLSETFERRLGNGVFVCLYSVLTAVLFSLPLPVLLMTWFFDTMIAVTGVAVFVPAPGAYLLCLAVEALLLSLFCLPLRALFVPWYLGKKREKRPPDVPLRRMNRLQWGLLALGFLLLLGSRFLFLSTAYFPLLLSGLAALLTVAAVLAVFLARHGRLLLLPGLRNLLLLVPVLLLANFISPVIYTSEDGAEELAEMAAGPLLQLALGLLLAVVIPALFQTVSLLRRGRGERPAA